MRYRDTVTYSRGDIKKTYTREGETKEYNVFNAPDAIFDEPSFLEPELPPQAIINTRTEEELREIFERFLDDVQPCSDIPDCEKLRKEYRADINTAGGENCSGCTLNAIRAKYVAKIRRALKNKPNDT